MAVIQLYQASYPLWQQMLFPRFVQDIHVVPSKSHPSSVVDELFATQIVFLCSEIFCEESVVVIPIPKNNNKVRHIINLILVLFTIMMFEFNYYIENMNTLQSKIKGGDTSF